MARVHVDIFKGVSRRVVFGVVVGPCQCIVSDLEAPVYK